MERPEGMNDRAWIRWWILRRQLEGQLIDDFQAHLAGRAGDDAERGFVVARGLEKLDEFFARQTGLFKNVV